MNENFNLTRDKILTKKFTPNVKGYNPDEVDDFLDLIIADYAAFDRYMKESKSYIEELELGMNKLKAQNHQLDIENGQMKTRLSGIKDTDQVTSSNIDLIQRINALEKVLYKNGIDPSKIK
jgi:DivIVA domain-containing protein